MLGILGFEFYVKELDEEVGWLRDTGGPKRCGTCGVVRSAQSAGRAVRELTKLGKIPSANNTSQHWHYWRCLK